MSLTKIKLYIVLGIISFISIVTVLYFLFIKKKHYDCTKDTTCKSPNGCVNNVCTYVCANDTSCKSPSECVNNVCKIGTEVPDVDLGFVDHAAVYTKKGIMSIVTNNNRLTLPSDVFKKDYIIKTEGQDFPILSVIVDNIMNNIDITTSNQFEIPIGFGEKRPFSRVRFSS